MTSDSAIVPTKAATVAAMSLATMTMSARAGKQSRCVTIGDFGSKTAAIGFTAMTRDPKIGPSPHNWLRQALRLIFSHL